MFESIRAWMVPPAYHNFQLDSEVCGQPVHRLYLKNIVVRQKWRVHGATQLVKSKNPAQKTAVAAPYPASHFCFDRNPRVEKRN